MGDPKPERTPKVVGAGTAAGANETGDVSGGFSRKIHDAARKTDGYTNQAKLYAPKELSPDKLF